MLLKVLPTFTGTIPTPDDMIPGAEITLNIEFPMILTPDFMTEILNCCTLIPCVWNTIEVTCHVVRKLGDLMWLVRAEKVGGRAPCFGRVAVVVIMGRFTEPRRDVVVIGYADYQYYVSRRQLRALL